MAEKIGFARVQKIFVSEEASDSEEDEDTAGHDDTGHDAAALPLSRRGLAMAMDAFPVSPRAALEALDAETGGAARRELQAAADAAAAATFGERFREKKPHEIPRGGRTLAPTKYAAGSSSGGGRPPARAAGRAPTGVRRSPGLRLAGLRARLRRARARGFVARRKRGGARRDARTSRKRAARRRRSEDEASFSLATISTICGRTRTRFEVSRAMTVVLTVSTKARRRGASPRSAPAFSTSRASASPAGDWTSPRFRPRPRNRNGATVA